MGYMSEYINRKLSVFDLESELLKLISNYNKLRQTFMILFVAAIGKPIPDLALAQLLQFQPIDNYKIPIYQVKSSLVTSFFLKM